jgi:hypothetical protein
MMGFRMSNKQLAGPGENQQSLHLSGQKKIVA